MAEVLISFFDEPSASGQSKPVSEVAKLSIVNVHLEDMKKGIHEHLMFGEGEIGYEGGVHVELSRHSHFAPMVAREFFEFLTGHEL